MLEEGAGDRSEVAVTGGGENRHWCDRHGS